MTLLLPQYRSHKVVSAAKIVAIDHGERLDLIPYGVVEVGADWIREKHAESGGYFVVYEDGYSSFSPAAAFEQGYTPTLERKEERKITDRYLSEREMDTLAVVKAFGKAANETIQNVRACTADARAKANAANDNAEKARIDAAEPERWAAIARTHFQEGLMALTRAIAQPGSF